MKLPIKIFSGDLIKTVKKLKKDTVLYRDGDGEFCWIVLVSKEVVVETTSHYMAGESFQLYNLSDFIKYINS